MNCVILAGGTGSRFWPYSREHKPKQLLNIFGDKSMLQMTVDRLKKVKRIKKIYIVTRKGLYNSIISEINGVDPQNVIVEPSGKNTAPAIGMIASLFALTDPDSTMGVFPADHLIVGHQQFVKAISTADHIARSGDNIVTIGIKPDHPSIAYGYVQYDEKSDKDYLGAYQVKTFAEKPHKKLAKRFVKSGDFLWNAGMFFGKVSTFINGVKKHIPELYEILDKIAPKLLEGESFDDLWDFIEPESIDYGLLEKASNIYVVEANFSWNDIGSWDALYNVFSEESNRNVIRGNGKVLDGDGNFIFSKKKFTGIIGLSDLVIINTKDATLVMPKNMAEEVKLMVEYLKQNDRDDLL